VLAQLTERPLAAPWIRIGAEFVVIVVGVLLALAVDQWASDRADRRAEMDHLQALAADLRSDSSVFVGTLIPVLGRAREAMDDIGPVVRGEAPVPVDTIAFLREVVWSTGFFIQLGVRTTFDELLSTGSLRLIQSAELRSSLASYYEVKRLTENRSVVRLGEYPDLVGTLVPGDAFSVDVPGPRGISTVGGALAGGPESEIRAFGVRRAVTGIRSEPFITLMNGHINYLGVLGPVLMSVNDQLQATLIELDGVIEARR